MSNYLFSSNVDGSLRDGGGGVRGDDGAGVDSATAMMTGPGLWTVLNRAYRSMAEVLEHSVAAEGLGLSDFGVLEVLLHKGPLPISTIGEKVLLTNASMTSAVDRLHARGLVVRTSSGEDRRVRLVSLTGEGRELITAVYGRHAEEIEQMMAGLSEAERATMRMGLKRIGFAAQAMAKKRGHGRGGGAASRMDVMPESCKTAMAEQERKERSAVG